MRKGLDVVLVVLAVAGLAYGSYTIGRMVMRESRDAEVRSSGVAQTLTANTAPAVRTSGPSERHRNILIGVSVIGALAAWIALGSLIGAMRRHRLRKTREWRLPR